MHMHVNLIDQHDAETFPHRVVKRWIGLRETASKIERECGWTPKETFDTCMRATVKWYLENDEWVRDVRSGAYREWIEKNYGTR